MVMRICIAALSLSFLCACAGNGVETTGEGMLAPPANPTVGYNSAVAIPVYGLFGLY